MHAHSSLTVASVKTQSTWRRFVDNFIYAFPHGLTTMWLQGRRTSYMSVQAPKVHIPGDGEAEALLPTLLGLVSHPAHFCYFLHHKQFSKIGPYSRGELASIFCGKSI
jgi:hypothetical protein